MQPVTGYTREVMARAGIPYAIPGLRHCVAALRNVGWWSGVTRTLLAVAAGRPASVPVPAPGERRGQWAEDAARRLLSDAGIPVVPACLVSSADEAVKAAAGIGGPLAVKIASANIVHKTDIGGVRLNVPPDESAVREAYLAVTAAAAALGPGAGAGRPGSARCAPAEPNFWSAWSATRCGA